jgi:cephalosporin hydroxylase
MDQYKNFKKECALEITQMASDADFATLSREWFLKASMYRYSYHFEWCGRPIIQYPQDIVLMQELIWSLKPDLIIETGIAHGGSLIFSASMMALLDYCDFSGSQSKFDPKLSKRKVIGIDIDLKDHNKAALLDHPLSHLIEVIEGSSVSSKVIAHVRAVAEKYQRILICLDSNHSHNHVLAELNAYASLTTVGSYCVVFDTVVEEMPNTLIGDRPWGRGNSPKTAVKEFLRDHPNFIIDKEIEQKLLVTVAPDGFLKRLA